MEPKSYQFELYERAKNNNVIIKLNTGSGKTFIASMLIKDYLNHNNDKKIFLLVKNASLAQQHTCYLQQYLFLKDEVDFFHGNMNNSWVDFWTKDKWAIEISKHKVIVMTAKVFLDILNHKKYSLDHISLLIFDEVHHLDKKDDYVQISEHLTSMYSHVKILGLTACLIKNVKKVQDIEYCIDSMERRLNCKIITSLDSIAREFSTNIKNIFIEYNETESEDVELLREILNCSLLKIMSLDSSTPVDRVTAGGSSLLLADENPYTASKRYITELLSVLGSLGIIPCKCIVDIFLQDISTLFNGIKFLEEKSQLALKEFKKCLLELKEAIIPILLVSTHLNCSFKLRELIKFIKDERIKCIDQDRDQFILIFVTERIHALALNELLNLLPQINKKLTFIKSDFIIGHSTVTFPKKMSITGSVQQKILNRFRQKQFNILVATNVVEEGLDIPHCNVVVKFDPPSEFRSYLQSKGRARGQDSLYVIFCESKKLGVVQLRIDFFDKINKEINKCLRTRTIENDNCDDEMDGNVLDHEGNDTDYMPYGGSGARITLNSAAGVLNRYIGKLRCNSLCDVKIKYSVATISNLFEISLLLPMPSPYLEEIKSGLHMNKRTSRRHANLEACKILHQLDELDSHLLPYCRYDEEEEILSSTSRGSSDMYKYEKYIATKLRSEFQSLSESTDYLYLYSIRYSPHVFMKLGFEDFSAFDMSASIGILLPQPIHKHKTVAKFPIYLVGGKCLVEIVFEEKLFVSPYQLASLLRCHELLFQIYAQRIRKFVQNISYSPQRSKCSLMITVLKDFKIDFRTIESIISKKPVVNLTERPQSDWVGSVIRPTYLKKEFGAFIVIGVCPNTTGQSTMPNTNENFRTHFEKKYQLTLTDEEAQRPLVNVKRLTTIQSCINKEKRIIKDSRRLQTINERETLFIPFLTECISLSSSIWTLLCIFPTIHHRLNQIFIVEECASTFDFLELCDSSNFVEVDFDSCYNIENILSTNMDVDVNSFICNMFPCFVSKICNDRLDLEQYEILGDSFLKFITSKYLYHFSKPTDNEGRLTQRRTKLISNNTLFLLAQKKELSKYLFFSCFDPKANYMPPYFAYSGDDTNPREKNSREFVSYKSKCLADCVEALIGCILTNYGPDHAIRFLLWIDMNLIPSDYTGDRFEILAALPTLFGNTKDDDPPIPSNISELETILNYTFTHKAYAVQAITHPTSTENRMFSCYQRLEFLGDAVLDFLVTTYIMSKNTKMRPGKITNLRSALVSNRTFAFLSAKWELYRFLNYFDPKMFFVMPDVVEDLIQNNLSVDTLFLKKSEHYKVIVKVLGDIFESLAGAIFVDSNYNLMTVWRVFERLMDGPLKRFSHDIPKNKIILLHERFPKLKCEFEVEMGTNLMILKATLPDGRVIEVKDANKALCKLSLVQELQI